MRRNIIHICLILLCLGAAFMASRREARVEPVLDAGLEVYIGEGCIHCHSEYRRPAGIDEELWGPPPGLEEELDRQQPVLFGNRRQGPDLSNVGIRRSRDWNRLHLMHPRTVRPGSRMPDYQHLFSGDGSRGEALLDYLDSLGRDNREAWLASVNAWQPETSPGAGDPDRGKQLFREYCTGCHGESGRGNGKLALSLVPAPRDLTQPSGWLWVGKETGEDRRTHLARLIKFGRPDTSMAGTEWLTEQQLADLIRFLETLSPSVKQ